MTDISMVFHCKDSQITEHYKQAFEKTFKELAILFVEQCEGLMKHRAQNQEHYDYIVDDEGCRQVLFGGGVPKLLYPYLTVLINTDGS